MTDFTSSIIKKIVPFERDQYGNLNFTEVSAIDNREPFQVMLGENALELMHSGIAISNAAPNPSSATALYPYGAFEVPQLGWIPMKNLAERIASVLDQAEIEHIEQSFSRYAAKHLFHCYEMVGTETFKECNEFIFYDFYKISLKPGNYACTFEQKILTPYNADQPFHYIDMGYEAKQIFPDLLIPKRQTVAHRSTSAINGGVYDAVVNLLINAFIHTYFRGCAWNGVLYCYIRYTLLDSGGISKSIPKYRFWLQRNLDSLRLIIQQCSSPFFKKMLYGYGPTNAGNYLYDGAIYNQPESRPYVETWLNGNPNLALLLFTSSYQPQRPDFRNLNALSPDVLTERLGLWDRKSYKTLLKLPPFLCQTVIECSLSAAFLYCLSHSRYRDKIHAYVCVATELKLRPLLSYIHQGIFDNQQKAYNNAVILFDLIYEQVLLIWAKFKCNSGEFYREVSLNCETHEVIDYFIGDLAEHTPLLARNHSHTRHPVPDECFLIQKINKKTTIKSLMREVERFRREKKHKRVKMIDYMYTIPPVEVDDFLITLIPNSHQLYDEGEEMQHCAYTTFHTLVEKCTYLICKIEHRYPQPDMPTGDIRATLGMNVHLSGGDDRDLEFERLSFHQCFSKNNRPASKAIVEAAYKYINTLNLYYFSELSAYYSASHKQEVFPEL